MTELEELSQDYGMFLTYKPFLREDHSNPAVLEALNDVPGDNEPELVVESLENIPLAGEIDADSVIEEREGVPYVNKMFLNPGVETEKKLNPDFKNLVNSIIKSTSSP
jgi:hypothetical protein